MKATNQGGFENAPIGTHLARCIKVIDVGTQPGNFGAKRKVWLVFELCHEKMENGEPFTVSNSYTLSLADNAHLRKALASWRGRDFSAEELEAGFDMKKILGAPCILSLVMNQEGNKTEIGSISPIMKGSEVPLAVNPLVYFSMEPDEFDRSIYDSFSDKVKNWIGKCPEIGPLLSAKKTGQAPTSGGNDDLPF